MRIKELSVRSFRNLKNIHLRPGPGINWFFGPNGQGKTNLLEAVFSSLRGKSFRPYSSRQDWLPSLAKGDANHETFVSLAIEDEWGYPLDCRMSFSPGRQWQFFMNEKRTPVARVRERVPVVVFSPDDHALVRWEPEVRRDFLDEMLTDVCPGYAEAHARYQATLKSRNKLLRNAKPVTSQKKQELEAWSETLARCAVELLHFRWEMWGKFEFHFTEILDNLFDDLDVTLQLAYAPDYSDKPTVEGCLKHILSGYDSDIETGWTHRGPHRDDFRIFIDQIDSRSGASQGQSRMIALALKWTHANWVREVRNDLPIFLVDDFSSEFDARRRKSLLAFLTATKGQVLVTGTDRTLVDSGTFYDYNLYSVKGGLVTSDSEQRDEVFLNV